VGAEQLSRLSTSPLTTTTVKPIEAKKKWGGLRKKEAPVLTNNRLDKKDYDFDFLVELGKGNPDFTEKLTSLKVESRGEHVKRVTFAGAWEEDGSFSLPNRRVTTEIKANPASDNRQGQLKMTHVRTTSVDVGGGNEDPSSNGSQTTIKIQHKDKKCTDKK